jgi:hypothetical protein
MPRKRLVIDLDESQHKSLVKMARARETTVSNLIRQALGFPIEHQGRKAPASSRKLKATARTAERVGEVGQMNSMKNPLNVEAISAAVNTIREQINSPDWHSERKIRDELLTLRRECPEEYCPDRISMIEGRVQALFSPRRPRGYGDPATLKAEINRYLTSIVYRVKRYGNENEEE